MLKMTIDIAPVPASRPRVTRFSTYFPKKYTKFRNDLAVILSDKGYEKLEGLLYAQLDFYMQIPKSWSKKKKLAKEGRYADNNVDVDNLVKAVLDGCEGVFYENDNQIAMIRARKFYSINGRIQFELSPIIEEAA
jgi:Holliday junction resolvase RusA-like endonuclease